MNFTNELADFYSKHFDDAKRMVENELFAVLRANTSFVMGVKLVRFDNNTGFAEANFLVMMNETARFQNNTIFDLRNAISNGTFRSLFVHQQFSIHIGSKCLHITSPQFLEMYIWEIQINDLSQQSDKMQTDW